MSRQLTKPSVYIETSVISYFTSRLSAELKIAVDQQVTREWWETALPNCDPLVSEYVIAEITRGDKSLAEKRFKLIKDFKSIAASDEIKKLALSYSQAIRIPTRAEMDAYHLAAASVHGLTYLVSWNCTHIASGRVRKVVQEINQKLGIPVPVICTPRELMEV